MGSQGREIFGQEARDLNLQMSAGDDGKGKPPRGTSRRDLERAKTVRNLPGLTGEPLRRLSSAETLEMYAPGTPYTLEGIPSGTRIVRVSEVLIGTALVSKILNLIEKNLGAESPSLVVPLGENDLNAEAQGILKIEMNRLFREKELPEGSVIALLIPKKNRAFLFQKEGNFSKMKTVTLQSVSERATSSFRFGTRCPGGETLHGILSFEKGLGE